MFPWPSPDAAATPGWVVHDLSLKQTQKYLGSWSAECSWLKPSPPSNSGIQDGVSLLTLRTMVFRGWGLWGEIQDRS